MEAGGRPLGEQTDYQDDDDEDDDDDDDDDDGQIDHVAMMISLIIT